MYSLENHFNKPFYNDLSEKTKNLYIQFIKNF